MTQENRSPRREIQESSALALSHFLDDNPLDRTSCFDIVGAVLDAIKEARGQKVLDAVLYGLSEDGWSFQGEVGAGYAEPQAGEIQLYRIDYPEDHTKADPS